MSKIIEDIKQFSQDKRDSIFFALILFLGLLVYSPSLFADFVFDDYSAIVENPFIRIFNLRDLWRYDPSRFLTNLTFGINYLLGGVNVVGWHLVNIILHAVAAFLTYRLMKLTFETPLMKKSVLQPQAEKMAVTGALLFLLHPIQTQAVIYIVQRSTLLATVFYLAALIYYLWARLEGKGSFYIKAVGWGYLAMLSKPLSLTLPLIIVVYEFCFFEIEKKLDIRRAVAFSFLSLILIIIPFGLLGFSNLNQLVLEGHQHISWIVRLTTQPNVLLTYIRLLFFPVHLNLDYDYPAVYSLLNFHSLAALLMIGGILGIAVHAFKKERLVTFGILWFFLTLLPVIIFPLEDIIFEHWLYLPSYGFVLVVVTSVFQLNFRRKMRNAIIAGILGGLTLLTCQRIFVWKDPIVLMQDGVKKSPRKPRAHNNLGFAYLRKGQYEKAEASFKKAIDLNPEYIVAQNNLASVYYEQNRLPEAKDIFERLVKFYPEYLDPYLNLAFIYQYLGEEEKSYRYFAFILERQPFNSAAHIGLGNIYQKNRRFLKAKAEFQRAIWLKPDNASAYYNLGNVYLEEGNFYEALLHYDRAVKVNPQLADAYINSGNIYYYFQDYKPAIEQYQKAIQYRPQLPEAHFNLANALHATGAIEDSRQAAQKAAALYRERGQIETAERIEKKLQLP